MAGSFERYKGFSLEQAQTPPSADGLYRVMKNRYWAVLDGKLLFFKGYSPQCNRNYEVVRRITDIASPGTEIKFVEQVFIPMKETEDGAEPDSSKFESVSNKQESGCNWLLGE